MWQILGKQKKKKKKLGKIVGVKYSAIERAKAVWLWDAAQAGFTFVADNCFADDKFSHTFNVFSQEHNIGTVDDAFLDSCKVQKVFNIKGPNHITGCRLPYLPPKREETH